ncbi:hypothetical protein C3L33_11196, partial [Rhododendron williamsianum]
MMELSPSPSPSRKRAKTEEESKQEFPAAAGAKSVYLFACHLYGPNAHVLYVIDTSPLPDPSALPADDSPMEITPPEPVEQPLDPLVEFPRAEYPMEMCAVEFDSKLYILGGEFDGPSLGGPPRLSSSLCVVLNLVGAVVVVAGGTGDSRRPLFFFFFLTWLKGGSPGADMTCHICKHVVTQCCHCSIIVNLYQENAYPFIEARVELLEKADEEAKNLPPMERHAGHRHDLTLVLEGSGGGPFICCDCDEQGSGWAYQYIECGYEVHPKCVRAVESGPIADA